MTLGHYLKIILVSAGTAKAPIVKYNQKLSSRAYRGKIVVIHDLDASEIITKLEKPAGVIAEIGGIMAHGAVLLREYNIPAGILPNAEKILVNGRQVSFGQDDKLYVDKKRVISIVKPTLFQPQKRGAWTIVKPIRREDKYGQFIYSFAMPGFKITSQVLLRKKQASEMKYDNKGIWVKNHPTPREICQKILADDKWFKNHIQRELRLFIKLKKWQKAIKRYITMGKQYNLRQCFTIVKICQNWFKKIRPYIYLFADGIDYLQKEFSNLCQSFLTPLESARVYDIIGRSTYAKIIKKYKIINPRPGKTTTFQYQPFEIVPAVPDWRRQVKLPQDIAKKVESLPSRQKRLFYRYLEVMPIMTEFNDEMCYVPRQIISAVPVRFLKPIADTLVKYGYLSRADNIFQHNIDDVGKMLIKLIKKEKQFQTRKFKIAS